MSALAAIHVAKKQLGLDDDTYRDVLERVTGKRSAKFLTVAEGGRVLEEMRRLGFERTSKPDAAGALKLDGPYAAKLRALWISGWNLGVVHDRTDEAMAAFVKRQTGIDHVNWLRDAADATRAIEGVKAWLAREAGVQWPGRAPLPNASKHAVIAAQLRILDLPADHGAGRGDLDRFSAELGKMIRKLKRAS